MESKVIRVPSPVYQEVKKRAELKQQSEQRPVSLGEIVADLMKEVSSR